MKAVKILAIMTAAFIVLALIGGLIADIGLTALPLVLIGVGLIGGLISGIALIAKLLSDD